MAAYRVLSPIKVETPTRVPGSVAVRIARRGDLLPSDYDEKQIKWMLEHGVIEEIAESEEAPDPVFNPDEHNQDAVLAYLAEADAEEVARVIELEKQNRGEKARKGIVGFAPKVEDPVEGDSGEASEDPVEGDSGEESEETPEGE